MILKYSVLFLTILIIIAATFYLLNIRPFSSPFEKPSKIYKIGILQMTSELDDTVYGFENRLKELGYIEGKNAVFIYRNSEGDLARVKENIKFFTEENVVDLLYTLTTPVTSAVKEATAKTNIPIVFGPVTDPVLAGLVKSVESSGNNLTGIMAVAYPKEKVELLLEQKPSIKTIGVIYRAGDKSSGPEVERLKQVIAEKNLKLKEKTIVSAVEIPAVANELAQEVDALYGANDGVVSSAVDFLINAANQNRIPLVTPTERGVKRGGLLYFGPDYFAMGEAAADMADKIFKGVPPSQIPIIPTPKLWIAVNLDTAQKTDQPIAPSILEKANYIHKTQ